MSAWQEDTVSNSVVRDAPRRRQLNDLALKEVRVKLQSVP